MKSKALNPSTRLPINRCTAHRRNGDPCKNAALAGSTVCRVHGGSAPQVKRAAQVRLAMATEALVQRLLRMADDETVPPAVRLAAIRDALDRANVVGTQEVAITATVKPWEQVMQTRITKVYNVPESDENVIDAELVENSDADRTLDISVRNQMRDAERRTRQPVEPRRRARALRPAGESVQRRSPEPETPDWYSAPPTRASDAEWAERGRSEARRAGSTSQRRKPGQARR